MSGPRACIGPTNPGTVLAATVEAKAGALYAMLGTDGVNMAAFGLGDPNASRAHIISASSPLVYPYEKYALAAVDSAVVCTVMKRPVHGAANASCTDGVPTAPFSVAHGVSPASGAAAAVPGRAYGGLLVTYTARGDSPMPWYVPPLTR